MLTTYNNIHIIFFSVCASIYLSSENRSTHKSFVSFLPPSSQSKREEKKLLHFLSCWRSSSLLCREKKWTGENEQLTQLRKIDERDIFPILLLFSFLQQYYLLFLLSPRLASCKKIPFFLTKPSRLPPKNTFQSNQYTSRTTHIPG